MEWWSRTYYPNTVGFFPNTFIEYMFNGQRLYQTDYDQ